MAKKRELITKGSAIRRLHVASEIPPFGPELVVRQMILRQSYRMAGPLVISSHFFAMGTDRQMRNPPLQDS